MPHHHRLILTVVLVNLFSIILATFSAYHGHRQYRERAEVTTQNLVYALENNLVNIVRRVDVSLLALLDIHGGHRTAGRLDAALMNQAIEHIRARLPEVDAIRITDAQGVLILGSGVEPGAAVSLADRPHFVRLRDDADAALLVSKPQVSRVNGKWVIVLARRVSRPDGAFDGMIFAALGLEALTGQFSALNLGSGGAVVLRDGELGLIVSHPALQTAGLAIGQKYVPAEMQALVEAGQTRGTYFSHVSIGQRDLMASFRKVGDYPLYASVGLAADDYLAAWRGDTLKLALTALLFLLASVYVAYLQYRSWLRHQESNAIIFRQEALYHELVEGTPMLVARYLPDGTISFANTAYARFFGTTAEQLVGRCWLELLPDAADRAAATARIAALTPQQPVSPIGQYRVRGQDGQTHWMQWTDHGVFTASGELVHLQAVGEDITERKRVRDIQAARLRLMEFAAEHSLHELLVATLDEAVALTESAIGFYHFLDHDQKTLSLQAWSTQTSRHYCKAEGDGRHYDVDAAGVWVEAIRQRRPVIHNDYASLPNKQGLPTGHAELLREMVTPVFRKGLIVAILGVGNKATPYTDIDLDTIAQLADLAWDIAEGKRLEAELVEMATTDPLTSLLNRRSFLIRMDGEMERLKRFDIERAAVLMLDLDHFKRVNDGYGHAAGDAVLRHFSGLVREALRKIDSGGRLGGEEFAILLLGADLAAAELFAERLRRRMADAPCVYEGRSIMVTVSIGIATLDAADGRAELSLSRADAALYDAKRGGRDRVCIRPS